MALVRRPVQIIRDHARAYLVVNLLMYGLVLAGFALGLAVPGLTADRAATLQSDGTADLVARVFAHWWLFAATILGVNVITVGLFSIVLPSLVIPFAGVAVFAYRAVVIGVTLAPTDHATWIVLVPHALTLVIEFQAYILLVLGAYLVRRGWVTPQHLGAETRRGGYAQGLRMLGWLGVAALTLLVVGAIYEAVTLRYLVPVMLRG